MIILLLIAFNITYDLLGEILESENPFRIQKHFDHLFRPG